MKERRLLLLFRCSNFPAGGQVSLRPGGRDSLKARGGAHPRYFPCWPKESKQGKGSLRLALRYAPGSPRCPAVSRGIYPSPEDGKP